MAEIEGSTLQPHRDSSSGASGDTEVHGSHAQSVDGSEISLGFREGRNDDVVDSIDARSSDFLETGDISAMAECEAAFQPRNEPSSAAELSAHSSDVSETGDIAAMAECETAFQPGNAPSSAAELSAHSSDVSETGDITAMAECETAFQPRNEPSSAAELSVHSSDVSETGDIAAMAECETAFQPRNEPLSAAASGSSKVREIQTQSRDGTDSVSEIDNLNDMTPRKESKFRSGYDLELEDDDNSDASSVSSREVEADRGVEMWKRRPSQPEDDGWEEGWEEIGTSTDSEWKVLPPAPPETRPPRREVYRMPGSDAEEEYEGGENPTQLLSHPAGFIVGAIEFQLNLIVHVIAIGIWLFNISLSSMSDPISRTVAVKDQLTSVTSGAASQVVELFSFVGDGVSQAGPAMGKLSKRTFWGCLTVAYVICVLGLLLIPALLVNIVVVDRMVEHPVVIRKALDFDFTQPKPVALLPLFSSAEVERIKNLAPDKVVKTRVIPLGSTFHVTVVLTMPESDFNMKLGMFQVTAEVLSARDQVIMRSSKPSRLRFKSYPIHLVNTLLYAIPHLVGLSKEAQTIQIRVLEAKEKTIPSASVRILIESKASFQDGGGGVPEIYEAAVRLESTLPWPRSIMSSFKWVFFVWNGLCLFIFEVGVVLCCCRRMILPSFGSKVFAEEEIVIAEVKDEKGMKEAARGSSRKARGNRRVYFEDGIPGAAADAKEKKGPRAPKNEEKGDGAGGIARYKDPLR